MSTTTEQTYSVEGAVAKGAAWLDENKPGWIDMINIQKLEMSNCLRCALGQIFRNYRNVIDCHQDGDFYKGWKSVEWSREHGFEKEKVSMSGLSREVAYSTLTLVWKKLILSRRATRTSVQPSIPTKKSKKTQLQLEEVF